MLDGTALKRLLQVGMSFLESKAWVVAGRFEDSRILKVYSWIVLCFGHKGEQKSGYRGFGFGLQLPSHQVLKMVFGCSEQLADSLYRLAWTTQIYDL